MKFRGLTATQAEESRAKHGANILAPPARKPWWKHFLEKFDDPVIRILLIAAAIAAVTGELIEGIGIIIAVLLATGLAFLNEFKAEKEFDILNKVNDDIPSKTFRDGELQLVPRKDIVVGDVVFVEPGEEFPADGRVLEAVNLQVDQSRLTGESDPVRKIPFNSPELSNMDEGAYPAWQAMRGTPVVDGYGCIEITAVGEATEIGRTARAAAEEIEEATPLNRQLAQLSKLIGVVGFSVAAFTLAALVIHAAAVGTIRQTAGQWCFFGILLVAVLTALARVWIPVCCDGLELLDGKNRLPVWFRSGSAARCLWEFGAGLLIALVGLGVLILSGALSSAPSAWLDASALHQFISFFMVAVTLIVVSVPEGLAMSVTLSLAYSMRKMMASNNLVRKMHACETIGAATVICTDKTGTLTMNQMRVRESGIPRLKTPGGLDFVALSIAANSTAKLSRAHSEAPQPIGNPTEGALLLWLDEQGKDCEALRESFRIETQWTFTAERKFMATKGTSENEERTLLFVKGGPEIVLNLCSALETADGTEETTEEKRQKILAELKTCQARGMRTLGFAWKENPADGGDLSVVAQDMTWLGFVAIADPVRPDVPDAVRACCHAGIQVKMVTGDNPETAKEIGRQSGLWEDGLPEGEGLVMTGAEFEALSDEEAVAVARKLRIMARARPTDKLRLVRSLKASGEVVAVTGDGTNDAPALNFADVGIAMGKTGTSIAKEAADVILLDDSFPSIVNAVMWGRSLYRNIQRFILFQLTVNVVALMIAMLGPFLGVELPLTVIQMLWVNLIMDTFAALALATEPPNPETLNHPPRKSSAFIVTPAMWGGIFGTAAVFLVFLVGILRHMKAQGLDADARWLTIFFSLFVMLQFWNLFNAKSWGGTESLFSKILNNKAFLMIAGGIFFGQIAIVQFGGQVFRTIPLSLTDWCVIVAATSLVVWIGESLRLILRLARR